MYLPLTGYRIRRNNREEDMSIDSIGPSLNASIVQPSAESAQPNSHAPKIEQPHHQEVGNKQDLTEEQKQTVVDGFYAGTGMNTQDFISLHNQNSEDPFAALDAVISRMKEDAETTGEMIETIVEMAKKVSKDNIALQVLQKTLEAMDENSGKSA